MPKMARNRSALHDVLAQGASYRDITVFVIQSFPQNTTGMLGEVLRCIVLFMLFSGYGIILTS